MKTTMFCALFFSCATVFSGPKEEKMRRECLAPTVCIHNEKEQSFASGCVVRSDKVGDIYRNVVITANHCILSENIAIRMPSYNDKGYLLGYKLHPMRVYGCDEEFDIAVVVFESKEAVPVAKFGMDSNRNIGELEFGQKVFRIGFGMGEDARYDEGQITAPASGSKGKFEGHIRTNVFTIFGDSGGPLFDENNTIIGICRGIRLHQKVALHQFSYYVPLTHFKKWDESANNPFDFVYNHKAEMPKMAFSIMKLEDYEAEETDDDICKSFIAEKSYQSSRSRFQRDGRSWR